jgi:two-component system nitrate/nitrite response regulator NarL
MEKIKIILVDDHIMVIKGFKNLLIKNEKFDIVGTATNIEQALELVEKERPNIVLMDINMGEQSGIDCTSKILDRFPDTKVIMLTMHHEDQYIQKALSVGAVGYILKNSDIEELNEGIENVYNGGNFFSRIIREETINKILQKIENAEEFYVRELTNREIQIIQAISEGLNNKQIAKRLHISDRTVNSHRTNIMHKMNVKNSVELVVKAIREKII